MSRTKASLDELGSSSELSSLRAQPVPDASGKALQTAPVNSAHPHPSLGPGRLPVFDEEDSRVLDPNGGLRACATHRIAAVPSKGLPSKGHNALRGLTSQPSSADASGGHTQPHSCHSFDGVGQHGTHHSSGMEATDQEVGRWLVSSMQGGLGSSGACAQWMVDQQDRAANQWRERRKRGVRLRPLPTDSETDELLSTQLERFLSLLVRADSRLVGSNVGYRMQLADCRLATDREAGSWAEAVYDKLTAILQETDPWKQQLRRVEGFVTASGRLPRHQVKDVHERALGTWLYNRGMQLNRGELQADRLRSLLNSSSILVRQRVEGWLSKDPDCAFKRGCLQLKHYIQQNGKLPVRTRETSHSHDNALALWLYVQRNTGMISNPGRRAMLESVHPLVAELLAEWDSRPPKVRLGPWRAWLHKLVQFTQDESRLPQYCLNRSERGLYAWLNRQLHRLGQLPEELVEQLRLSHPLIGAAVESKEAEQSAA